MKLTLTVLKNKYSICKFENESALPALIISSDFYSVTKTKDEVSVITIQNDLITGSVSCSKDWRIIKIEGLLDFSLVGIIADISDILKRGKIPIFAISTYDTDYFLVKQTDLGNAINALHENGHSIIQEQ